MKAVVLVGGEGTRLRPLTLTRPKQMLPVVEQPMIERVIAHLVSYGIDEVVLSLGYRPDAFMSAYPGGQVAGACLSYAVEPEPLDTAGAVRFAVMSTGIDSTFVVVNGDILTDLDIGALIDFHRLRRAEATISLIPVDDPSRFGVVPTDDAGRVIAFVEKPPRGQAPTNLVNAGSYVMEPSVVERVPGDRRCSVERETFPAMVTDGSLYALRSNAYWLDTGTPEAYLKAHRDLLDGTRLAGDVAVGTGEEVPPAPGAYQMGRGVWALGRSQIEGEVLPFSLVGARAVVQSGARVSGSVVGSGALVATGAVVADSVLLPGSRVLEGSQVRGSILGQDAQVGPGCVVGGLSIIGDEVVVGEGSFLDGARIPGSAPS